jgi:hypothetical protein
VCLDLGIALFLSGQTSFQLNVTSAGPIPISGLAKPLFGQQAGSSALSSILSADESNLFAKEYEVIIGLSIAAQASLAAAMLPAGVGEVANSPQYLDPVTNKLTNNPLATSLQTVARIIGGRSSLGVSRQIFYVQLGGFDTHDNQAPQHSRLLTDLGQALEYFDAAMTTAGLNNQVTTFTASDFGRTPTANSDGTDHGWGSHHIVMGGAVNGQNMYANILSSARTRPTIWEPAGRCLQLPSSNTRGRLRVGSDFRMGKLKRCFPTLPTLARTHMGIHELSAPGDCEGQSIGLQQRASASSDLTRHEAIGSLYWCVRFNYFQKENERAILCCKPSRNIRIMFGYCKLA